MQLYPQQVKIKNHSNDINSASNGNGRLLVFERGFSQASYLEGNVTCCVEGDS